MIKLFDYQQEQVNEALNSNKVLNFSEVGTGKTFVGLEVFKQSNCKKLLIVCLAVKVHDFVLDGGKVGLGINALTGSPKRRSELVRASDAMSVSFESVWRTPELLSWVDKDTMILIDESHKVKSRGSKVGEFLEELSENAQMVYLMTASPITNGHYEDYYQQLKIAGVWTKDWKTFKQRYIIEELQTVKLKGGRQRMFNEIVGYNNVDELNQLVEQHAVAKQRDISEELIPQDIFYYVKKPTMYGHLLKTRVVELSDGTVEEMDSTSKMFSAMRQLSSGVLKGVDKVINKGKLERVEQILTENENDRVVIFYNYNSELSALKELVKKLKRPLSEMNGHKKNLSNYKNKENGVALVQYKSGSTGVNDFILSQVCIFFSSPDSSTTYIQAKGRLNRHGQTRRPLFYHLICSNSVESKLFDNVLDGKDINDSLIDSLVNSEY